MAWFSTSSWLAEGDRRTTTETSRTAANRTRPPSPRGAFGARAPGRRRRVARLFARMLSNGPDSASATMRTGTRRKRLATGRPHGSAARHSASARAGRSLVGGGVFDGVLPVGSRGANEAGRRRRAEREIGPTRSPRRFFVDEDRARARLARRKPASQELPIARPEQERVETDHVERELPEVQHRGESQVERRAGGSPRPAASTWPQSGVRTRIGATKLESVRACTSSARHPRAEDTGARAGRTTSPCALGTARNGRPTPVPGPAVLFTALK